MKDSNLVPGDRLVGLDCTAGAAADDDVEILRHEADSGAEDREHVAGNRRARRDVHTSEDAAPTAFDMHEFVLLGPLDRRANRRLRLPYAAHHRREFLRIESEGMIRSR